MRIALFSWETLHSIAVGGVGVHVSELAAALQRRDHEVHVFTRIGPGQSHYEVIHGVHYHRCGFRLNPNFVDEINNMCRSFVHVFCAVEDHVGRFDVVHAHDWLASNAVVWIKEGRGRRAVLTMHSTEYGRNGNRFFGGQSARVQDHERHGTYCADRVITVSNQLKAEIRWLYHLPDHKTHMIYNGVNSSAVRLRRGRRRSQAPVRHRPARPDRAVRRPNGGAEGAGHPGADDAVGPALLSPRQVRLRRRRPHARRGVRHRRSSWAWRTPCGCWATAAAASCTTCSRRATSWRCPAGTSRSASSSSKAGAPTSRWSAPSAAGRPSSSGTASTACRWTTRRIRWPGAWARSWPTTTAAAGWAATAGPPSMPPSAGTRIAAQTEAVYASVA